MKAFDTEPTTPTQVNVWGDNGNCWHCSMFYCVCDNHPPRTPAMVPSVSLPVKAPRRRATTTVKIYFAASFFSLMGSLGGNNWQQSAAFFWLLAAAVTHRNDKERAAQNEAH